jgi:plastocyanin
MARTRWIAALALVVALAAACGSDDTPSIDANSIKTTTTSSTTSTTAGLEATSSTLAAANTSTTAAKPPATTTTAKPSATTTTTAAPPTTGTVPAPKNHDLTIRNFAFSPPVLQVRVGDSVTAKNEDSATHTWTADGGAWDSGNLANGATFKRTFDKAGTFAYHCEIHGTMKGTVQVS